MKAIKRKIVFFFFSVMCFVFCTHMMNLFDMRIKRRNYVNNGTSFNTKSITIREFTGSTFQAEPILSNKFETCTDNIKPLLSGIQMSEEQINVIRDSLPEEGNVLVWGLGNDSPYWYCSTNGKVIFIEDDSPLKKAGVIWYDKIMKKYPFLEAYRVHYTTNTVSSFDNYVNNPETWSELDLSSQLPVSVTQTHWHVIIVDAPLGCCNRGPGRYQSIYTSSVLARTGTHIFVDDYERKVEHTFSQNIFGEPMEVITRQTTSHSRANQQAHFKVNSEKQTTNEHGNGIRPNMFTTKNRNIHKMEADNWTILLSVNNGFFDFFENWLWHFKKLHINIPIYLMAEDSIVFNRITDLNDSSIKVQRSKRISINETVDFKTDLYKKMVSARPIYILEHLKYNINVIYSDIDTVWLQNPLPYLKGNVDIWSQLDGVNNFCTGFLAIKSNNNTLEFMQKWANALKVKLTRNQAIFNRLLKTIPIKIKGLDSKRFPSGKQYFNQYSKEERSGAVVVHNNWIIGHERKLQRFRNMKLWVNGTAS